MYGAAVGADISAEHCIIKRSSFIYFQQDNRFSHSYKKVYRHHTVFMINFKVLVKCLSATPFQCPDWEPGDLPETLIFRSPG